MQFSFFLLNTLHNNSAQTNPINTNRMSSISLSLFLSLRLGIEVHLWNVVSDLRPPVRPRVRQTGHNIDERSSGSPTTDSSAERRRRRAKHPTAIGCHSYEPGFHRISSIEQQYDGRSSSSSDGENHYDTVNGLIFARSSDPEPGDG